MFKLNSKSFNEPIKQSYISEDSFEQESADEADDIMPSDTLMLAQFLSSTGPEEYSNSNINNNNTNIKKFKKASRILSRLRKQPTMTALGSRPTTEEPKKHIPLQVNYVPPLDLTVPNISAVSSPVTSGSGITSTAAAAAAISKTNSNKNSDNVNNNNNNSNSNSNSNRNSINSGYYKYSYSNYYKNYNSNYSNVHQAESVVSNTMRDSGIYSETMSTSEKPSCMTINDLSFPHPPPCRPEPLPVAIASAAIATACQTSGILSPRQLRSVPEAALKRKSIRLRHIQIQTEPIEKEQEEQDEKPQPESDQRSCPHCRQVISNSPSSLKTKRQRRPSCPPALASGPTRDTRQLYDLIHSLKSQLDQERKYRQELEKRVDQHHLTDKKEELLKEKSKWEGDCLWMNDRMALIRE